MSRSGAQDFALRPPRMTGSYYSASGGRNGMTPPNQEAAVALAWLPGGVYDALAFDLVTPASAVATFEPLIYDSSGAGGGPGAKIASAGQQQVGSGTATGRKLCPVAFSVVSGWYWLGGHALYASGSGPGLTGVLGYPGFYPSPGPGFNNDTTSIRRPGMAAPPDPFAAVASGSPAPIVFARAA